MNFTDLQAARGGVQLARFDTMAVQRLRLAKRYQERFGGLGDTIKFQQGVFSESHARHLLVGLFDPEITGMSRNALLLALRQRNIGASIHYTPQHAALRALPYQRFASNGIFGPTDIDLADQRKDDAG